MHVEIQLGGDGALRQTGVGCRLSRTATTSLVRATRRRSRRSRCGELPIRSSWVMERHRAHEACGCDNWVASMINNTTMNMPSRPIHTYNFQQHHHG